MRLGNDIYENALPTCYIQANTIFNESGMSLRSQTLPMELSGQGEHFINKDMSAIKHEDDAQLDYFG